MSATGATIEINSVGIPDDFTLLIRPEIIKRHCHVVWRSEHRLGVRFTLGPADSARGFSAVRLHRGSQIPPL
jgi:hypothetical protein